MACSRPFTKRVHFKYAGEFVDYQIPCGYCLNCRIDQRDMWTDRFEMELQQTGLRSAFVTFTYADCNLPPNSRMFGPEAHLPVNASLCRKDFERFIDRLHYKVNLLAANNVLPPKCSKDFKFIAVGEYGDKFGRPHYHMIVSGLDFHDCKPLFNACWKKGLVDSLPILNGGIRYVLDYLDKQCFGSEINSKYIENGLEPPFHSRSVGIGRSYFLSDPVRLKLLSETGTYVWRKKTRPLPVYYKHLVGYNDLDTTQKELRMATTARLAAQRNMLPFDFKEYNRFAHEARLRADMINHGKPVGLSPPEWFRIEYKGMSDKLSFDDMNGVLLDVLDSLDDGQAWYAEHLQSLTDRGFDIDFNFKEYENGVVRSR